MLFPKHKNLPSITIGVMDNDTRQKIASYIHDRMMRGGNIEPSDPELYDEVKKRVYEEYPIHSLYRSALVHGMYHDMIGGSVKADKFMKQLEKAKMSRAEYLAHARMMARHHGYVPNLLTFAGDNDHKLKYESPKGVKYFGKAGYGDYIIYQHMEKTDEVERGYARNKRKVFRDSHEAISRIHKLDRYSPNELAINILW
jgi:hypothetical protein